MEPESDQLQSRLLLLAVTKGELDSWSRTEAVTLNTKNRSTCWDTHEINLVQVHKAESKEVAHCVVFLTWHMPKPPGQRQHSPSVCVGCVGLCPRSPLAKSTARFLSHWDSQQAPWSSSEADSHAGSSIAPQQLCYRGWGLFYSGTE